MLRALIAGAMTLALLTACGRRDDGMGELWKGVRYCIETEACR